MNNMLTIEEVQNYLDINESEAEKLIQNGKLQAFKIGGSYIRFRKEEVMNLRFELHSKRLKPHSKPGFFSKVGDFWRFNNFYIVSLILVGLLIYFAVGF